MRSFHRTIPLRQGYVLITTVLVMALLSLLLVSIANQSMRLATSAVLEEEALQSRWASISVQHATLRNAELILNYRQFTSQMQQARSEAEADDENGDELLSADINWRQDFPTHVSFHLELNGQTQRFLLADENCKINLEKLRQQQSDQASLAVMNGFLQQSPGLRQQQLLSPGSWESWRQILQPSDLGHTMQGIEQATTQVTLWSNGKVNHLRCSDEVFRVSLELILLNNQARKLVELRQEQPTWKLSDLLTSAGISDEKQQQVLRGFLADERSLGDSQEPLTFSLWMRNGQQPGLQFHVMATTAQPQHLSFVW